MANQSWIDRWVSTEAGVSRRKTEDVYKLNGGGGCSDISDLVAALTTALGAKSFSLFEVEEQFVLVKEDEAVIHVLHGKPYFIGSEQPSES